MPNKKFNPVFDFSECHGDCGKCPQIECSNAHDIPLRSLVASAIVMIALIALIAAAISWRGAVSFQSLINEGMAQ